MNPQTGALVEKWDKRNYLWEKIGFGAAPFDWTKGYRIDVPSIKDQKFSLSCGGQAFSYYGEVLNNAFDNTNEERSAKFIYSQSFELGGGSGATKLCKTVTDMGWGLESLTPSKDGYGTALESFMIRREDITQEAFKTALKDRAFSYAWISQTNIDAIAQAIQINHGAVLGISGSHSAGWTTKFPASVQNPGFNHWLYACGAEMIDGKKYIIVKNSWGNVGENGYQWLSEDFFIMSNCFGAITLVYNTKPQDGFKHTFNINLQRGQAGDEIKALQAVLRLEGLFTYPIDTGSFGEITQKAVYDFQVKYNLAPATRWLYKGFYCGAITRKKLNELYGVV